MRQAWKILFVLFCMLPVFQCCDGPPRPYFDKYMLTDEPLNFQDVNSEYDDYNSNISGEEFWEYFQLTFSTNRHSNGEQFDLVSYEVNLYMDITDNELLINAYENHNGIILYYYTQGNSYECNISEINSEYNELGPFSEFYETGPSRQDQWGNIVHYGDFQTHIRFLHADDKNGNLDIRCWYVHDYAQTGTILSGEGYLENINSRYNDAYPCIMRNDTGRESIYFTSDREGNYDIFSGTAYDNKIFNLADSIEILKINILSGTGDDKCPYIKDNIMVFTSNRDGGSGGFDLYFSVYGENGWSEPENFGDNINTEYDEYRPVFVRMPEEDFFYDLMIFSSNRPGGLGGFDLYYVGVPKSKFQ